MHHRGATTHSAITTTNEKTWERGAYQWGYNVGYDHAAVGESDNRADYVLPATTSSGNKGFADGYNDVKAGLKKCFGCVY